MILARYLTRQVVFTAAATLCFLVAVLLGGRLIRYLGVAAEGGLQLGLLLRLVGYNLPYFLELILPLSFFVALMLVFGRLYADSEMAALNASGVSRAALGRMLLPLVAVLVAAQAFLTLYAKPWGVRSADAVWQEQALFQVFDLAQEQKFVGNGNYALYVGQTAADRLRLDDVIVVEMSDDPNKAAIVLAQSATQAAATEGSVQLDLHQGRRYQVDLTSLAYNEIGFSRYRLGLEVGEPATRQARVDGQPTWSLLAQNDSRAKAQLAYRLCLPSLMWLALLLALPLSKTQPRQGRWLKLVPSILVFVAIAVALISLQEPIAKQKIGVWAYPTFTAALTALALWANVGLPKRLPAEGA